MRIDVAGAGAGKTTCLANAIIETHKYIPKNKNIYCVAFTNNAVASIKEKLISYYDVIPKNIVISTIHSFLYNEFVSPYFYLLYNKHYRSISTIQLPIDQPYKNCKLTELENKDILHIEKITERAKWVVAKKSTDKAKEKSIRISILNTFLTYCDTIFVDEAQDIDSNIKDVFTALDNIGVKIVLKGDPKQDIRGYGCFRALIESHSNNVSYDSTCYRCPSEHLLITNYLVSSKEKQVSNKTGGMIKLIFESECRITDDMIKKYDLKYIYKKNDRFETHMSKMNLSDFDNLFYEVHSILSDAFNNADVTTIELNSYRLTKHMIRCHEAGKSVAQILKPLCTYVGKLSKVQYAKVCEALPKHTQKSFNQITVNSIESVKGLEGNSCLFILTTDLAAYLFGKKTIENKTKNALYVALTRSLNTLTILISKDVEEEYGKQKIIDFFASFNNI